MLFAMTNPVPRLKQYILEWHVVLLSDRPALSPTEPRSVKRSTRSDWDRMASRNDLNVLCLVVERR